MKTIEQLRKETTECAEKASGIEAELDATGAGLQETMRQEAPGVFDVWMREELSKRPDEVARLDTEGKLKAMKEEYTNFRAELAKGIETAFAGIKIPHRNKNFADKSHAELCKEFDLIPARVFHSICSAFGAILKRYGLAGREWTGPNAKPVYESMVPTPAGLSKSFERYSELATTLFFERARLAKLAEELKVACALDSWDRA